MHEPEKLDENNFQLEEKNDFSGGRMLNSNFDNIILKKYNNMNEKTKEIDMMNMINSSKIMNNKVSINYKDNKDLKSKVDISSTLIHSAQNTNLSTPKHNNVDIYKGISNSNFQNNLNNNKKPSVTTCITGVTTKNNSRKVSEEKNGKDNKNSKNPLNKNYNNTIINSNNNIISNIGSSCLSKEKEKEKVEKVEYKDSKNLNPKTIISSTVTSSKVSLKSSTNNSNQNSNSNFILTGKIKKSSPIDLTNIIRTNIVQSSGKIQIDDNNYSSQNTGKNTPNSKAFLDGNSSKPPSENSRSGSNNDSKSKVEDLNNQIVKNGLKLYDNVQNNLNINKNNLTEKNNIVKKKGQILSIPLATNQSKQATKQNFKSENMVKIETSARENVDNKPIENNYLIKLKKESIKDVHFKKHNTSNNSPNHYPLHFNKEVNNRLLSSNQPKSNITNINHINNINININNVNNSKVNNSVSSVKVNNEQKIISLKTKSIIDRKFKENIKNTLNTSNTSIVSIVRESNYYKTQAENLIAHIKACKIVFSH